ncbi:MAG TPA: RidA family protein [Bacteroidales bacterium]|nr:RidA family protein [Bacteroidales bacterium]
MKTVRRDAIRKVFTALAGFAGFGIAASAGEGYDAGKAVPELTDYQDIPMFSGYTRLGNLVFVSGRGDRLDGDIKVHTDNVLKVIEGELKKAGSSMEKVLKVSVYLNDMKDFQGMNEVYSGRFGKNPPVRTTVAVPGGLPPADAYIQMDCIAYV